MCYRFRGDVVCFRVVDDKVVIIDGSCVGVVSSDVAALTRVLGCISRVCIAVSVVLGVVWVVELMLGVVITFFSEWEHSSSGSTLMFRGIVGLCSHFVSPRCCLGARITPGGGLGVSLDSSVVKEDSSSP
jgi:hypothetical protein